MSVVQVRAAYRVRAGSSTSKAVLIALADAACESCGLAWPGIARLAELTEASRASVTRALKQLEAAGLVRIRGYGAGGRGRSTEYVVMPALPGLQAAPCRGCSTRLVNPERRGADEPERMPASAAAALANLGLVTQRKP